MSPAPYSRRFQKQTRTPSATEKLIAFQLGGEQYAIPVDRVHSVINHFTAHASLETGQSIVIHNQEMITLVDVATLFPGNLAIAHPQFLVVCLLDNSQLLGIPVSEMPTILEADLSKLETLPPVYCQGDLSPAIEKLVPVADSRIVFYVNVDKLLLPTASSSFR
uniref:chemotaxis protein CheW n=1 Tax=Trichocoleus desertorum TaxID=1481672 RepID=UPI0025B370B9|nr:chemotaxis protein CheW [Trichocoleus desertorum]